LIVANGSTDKVSVFLNKGTVNGNFNTTPVSVSAAGIGPAAAAVADVNNDGNADIIVGGSGGVARVILGNGDGNFGKPIQLTTAVTQINSIVVADMDGDGNPDIVLGATRSTKGGKIDILLGNGNGTFQSPFIQAVTSMRPTVTVADVNSDGRFDLIVSETDINEVGVLLNTTASAPIIAVNESAPGNVSAMGTAGNDTISLSLVSERVVIQVNGESNSFAASTVTSISIFGALGNDSITIQAGAPAAFVSGGAGNDTIVADNSALNILKGAMGRDSIVSGGGAETLDGGMGADTLVAGPGDDSLTGDGANDSLMGGGGASVLDGGLGNNTLAAGGGNNTLLGNVGNDSIDGSGGGNDSLVGGGGMDTIIGATGSTGKDTIDPRGSTGILTPGPMDSVIGGA
jgi:Ca2+-binding RTX toxin-like protein